MNVFAKLTIFSLIFSACTHSVVDRSPAGFTALEQLAVNLGAGQDGVNTDAVIIFKDGQIIYENYAREYDKTKKHLSWSMAKTIAGLLIGRAIDEGRLSLDQKVRTIIPEFKSDATIRNLLNMSSGLKFKEEYSGVPIDSDATQMLYVKGPLTGFSSYATSLSSRAESAPGEHFYYSSGDTNILMDVLKKVIPDKLEYNLYPWKSLFAPLGITYASFEQDVTGVFVGSSYVYLTAQDYLKLGQLLMQDGFWEGTRVVPEAYMNLMKQVAPGVTKLALPGTSPTRSYSSHITTNLPIPGRKISSEYVDLPPDALLFIGHQGQLIVSSASQRLVIVRLAMDKGSAFDRKKFFKSVKNFIIEKKLKYETVGDSVSGPAQSVVGAPIDEKWVNPLDYVKVPQLVRALAAKEYCSCRFIVRRSHDACIEDLKVSLPVIPKLEINGSSVSAALFFTKAVAEFRGDNLGCTLTKPN